VDSENRWCDAPHIPGVEFEELGVRRAFEIDPKLLVNREIAFVCLRISAPVGTVLLRVELFNRCTELQPRAFTARRHPQQ
jgi:hypothetical protein